MCHWMVNNYTACVAILTPLNVRSAVVAAFVPLAFDAVMHGDRQQPHFIPWSHIISFE